MHGDDRRAPEPRRLDRDEPGRVVLGENLDVLVLRGPEPMQHHPAGAMVLVLLDVEERIRIARPDDVAGRAGNTVSEVLPALHVPNGDDVELRAEIVRAPGELGVVGRMARGGKMKERLSLSARVAVDQQRLLAALARPSAVDAMLPALAKA